MEENVEKTAIVTGASSGIGLCICKKLVSMGIKVYGIARNFKKLDNYENDLFILIECDITESYKLCDILKKIKKENEITLLVNNAGVGYYGLHEELNIKKISEMVRVNLEAPMIITNTLLRDLKKNKATIINISSVTANKTNPHGCAYGATKAGLTSFSNSLFDEARKYGVKVVDIKPDMTDTNLYRNADFTCSDEENAYINPSEIADTIEWILNKREGLVINEITIKPQLHRIKKRK